MSSLLSVGSRETLSSVGRRMLSQTRSLSSLKPVDYNQKLAQFESLDDTGKRKALVSKGLTVIPQNAMSRQALQEIKQTSNLSLLLPHISVPTLSSSSPSETQRHWEQRELTHPPLHGRETEDQNNVRQLALKSISSRTAVIGLGTWDASESFRFLREASNDVVAVSNVEANLQVAQVAHLTALTLGVNTDRFVSNQGNALEELPRIPESVEAEQELIVGSRFLPVLNPVENDGFLGNLSERLQDSHGVAVLSYSTIDRHSPADPVVEKYYQLAEDSGPFEKIDLPGGVGVSFISKIDSPKNGLIKGQTFQTFLFKDKVEVFFARQGLTVDKDRSSAKEDDGITREASVIRSS